MKNEMLLAVNNKHIFNYAFLLELDRKISTA